MAPLPDDLQTRLALAAHAARLKHDLGKYVAMQQRWLGPDPGPAALQEAVTADLSATRRGPDGSLDAPTVWAEFRPQLVGQAPLPDGSRVDLTADDDFQAIEQGMVAVEAFLVALRSDGLAPDGVVHAHRAALQVGEGCRALARRLGDWARRLDG